MMTITRILILSIVVSFTFAMPGFILPSPSYAAKSDEQWSYFPTVSQLRRFFQLRPTLTTSSPEVDVPLQQQTSVNCSGEYLCETNL